MEKTRIARWFYGIAGWVMASQLSAAPVVAKISIACPIEIFASIQDEALETVFVKDEKGVGVGGMTNTRGTFAQYGRLELAKPGIYTLQLNSYKDRTASYGFVLGFSIEGKDDKGKRTVDKYLVKLEGGPTAPKGTLVDTYKVGKADHSLVITPDAKKDQVLLTFK